MHFCAAKTEMAEIVRFCGRAENAPGCDAARTTRLHRENRGVEYFAGYSDEVLRLADVS